MSSLTSDVTRLVKSLETDHGCQVRKRGNGHWHVSVPGQRSITVSHSPSDQRALRNIRGDVRRYLGIEL